jgi:hypothetical protein
VAVDAYAPLAEVYEWLVPDALLEPEGAVGAFEEVVGELRPAARVLDCAAGTGQLAVGLAITTHSGRLTFWPFTHEQLLEDLRVAGLAPAGGVDPPTADRYLVTANAT